MSDDDDVTPAAVSVPDFYAARAAERAFPTRLPAPGMSGGLGLGAPVQLYSTDATPFPVPADVPASAPPVVASATCGSRVAVAGARPWAQAVMFDERRPMYRA